MTPEQKAAVREAVAHGSGNAICDQLELERVGEGDKQRVHFTLPGKALDLDLIADAAISAFLTAAEAQGFVMVPILPADQMRAAGSSALLHPSWDIADECYRRMLSARPR